jgi:transposase
MRESYPHSEGKLAEIDEKREEAFTALIEAVAAGKRVLYCDELSFSPYSTRAQTWAGKGFNQALTKGNLRLPALYAVVVISASGGLESFYMSEAPIVIADLLKLFWSMRPYYQQGVTTLFWDNLRSHHSRDLLGLVESFGWQVVFNAPYSSAWHSIETAFAQVKRHYRRELIATDFRLTKGQHWDLVERSLRVITPQLTGAVCQRSLSQMRSWLDQREEAQ